MINISTTKKAIGIIIFTTLIFITQLHYQTKGTSIYNDFLLNFTLNENYTFISIFSNMFLHANFIHLGMNMFFLFLLAKMFYEKSSFLKIYFISGLTASLFTVIYINIFGNVLVLGASGAIFGVFSYIFFKYNRRKEFYLNFLIFHALMLGIQMNIAWYAHLGGAIAGILYFYYENDIIPKLKRKKLKRI